MKFVKKIIVGSGQRAILLKDGKIVRVYEPGRYLIVDFKSEYHIELCDINATITLPELLAKRALRESRQLAESYFWIVELSMREVAVVYSDRKIVQILTPGETRLFWRGGSEIVIERFDISEEFEVPKAILRDLSGATLRSPGDRSLSSGGTVDSFVLKVSVPDEHISILKVDGVRARVLMPGIYGFWHAQRQLKIETVDTRLQSVEISGQEMLTRDKVTLRINLSASYRIADLVRAETVLGNMSDYLYRELQFGLREAVGQRTLDELLEQKDSINLVVLQQAKERLEQCGFELERVGVKDIILPGEMRALLNQVVEAEKAAQANNIRRREETAATRSLHNTARMIEGNPVLLRLKELEVLEKVSEKIEKLTVFDGLEGVIKGLVTLPSALK